jgi:hypothetical protein
MKIYLTNLLMVICCVASAQINKGNFMIGGNISFVNHKNIGNYTTYDASTNQYVVDEAVYKSNTLVLSPRAGYFFTDKFCAGLGLPVTFSTAKVLGNDGVDTESKSHSFHVGPFVRYYIPLKQSLYALVEAGYVWGTTRSETTGPQFDPNTGNIIRGTNTSKNIDQQIDGVVGVAYFLNPNVSVDVMAGYRLHLNTYHDTHRYVDLQIGLQVYLRKIRRVGYS